MPLAASPSVRANVHNYSPSSHSFVELDQAPGRQKWIFKIEAGRSCCVENQAISSRV